MLNVPPLTSHWAERSGGGVSGWGGRYNIGAERATCAQLVLRFNT